MLSEGHKGSIESKLLCGRSAKYKVDRNNTRGTKQMQTLNLDQPDRYLNTPPTKSNLMLNCHTHKVCNFLSPNGRNHPQSRPSTSQSPVSIRSILCPAHPQVKRHPLPYFNCLLPLLRARSLGCETEIAGLHSAAGGPDATISGELCSGDMLLEALVACAGVTLRAVATALEIELRSGEVRAEGDLDFRGTMGVEKSAPVGFVEIRLQFVLDTDAEQKKVDKLIQLTERYCVVLQTISKGPNITVSSTGMESMG